MKQSPMTPGLPPSARSKLARCTSHQLLGNPTSLPPLKLTHERRYLSSCTLQNQLQHYEWRQKTEFPVAKVHSFRSEKASHDKVCLEVSFEMPLHRLTDLKDLPLFKVLYLLKESMVACERLYSRFGPFLITSRMIVVTPQHTCRVWVNQNLVSNEPTPLKINQSGFLSILTSIVEEKCLKNKNSSQFFQGFKGCHSFYEGVTYIQSYCREHKIASPRFIFLADKELASLVKEQKPFDVTLTMGKSPKFLSNNLRSSLKPSGDPQPVINILAVRRTDEDPQMMKTSGDTAADMSGSKANSTDKEDDKTVNSLVFGGTRRQSGLRLGLKKQAITRKFSMPQNNQLMSPVFAKKKKNERIDPQNVKYKTISSAQDLAIPLTRQEGQEEEDQESKPVNIELMLSRNNWQATLNGLFTEGSPMKKSIMKGRDQRKPEQNFQKLKLLGSMGYELKQSVIHEDYEG